MSESVVWQCSGCELSIDPDDEVVESIERVVNDIGGVTQEYPRPHYAHAGHEGTDKLMGYHKSGQGKLRDLREREKSPPSPPV